MPAEAVSSLTASGGTTYTPGQQQTLTLTITDSKARVYGFQASARVDSNATNGQAGSFHSRRRPDRDLRQRQPPRKLRMPGQRAGAVHRTQPSLLDKFHYVPWTAPSTDVGTVTVYVAANAANGNGNETGDHIYTTKLQLSAGEHEHGRGSRRSRRAACKARARSNRRQ